MSWNCWFFPYHWKLLCSHYKEKASCIFSTSKPPSPKMHSENKTFNFPCTLSVCFNVKVYRCVNGMVDTGLELHQCLYVYMGRKWFGCHAGQKKGSVDVTPELNLSDPLYADDKVRGSTLALKSPSPKKGWFPPKKLKKSIASMMTKTSITQDTFCVWFIIATLLNFDVKVNVVYENDLNRLKWEKQHWKSGLEMWLTSLSCAHTFWKAPIQRIFAGDGILGSMSMFS